MRRRLLTPFLGACYLTKVHSPPAPGDSFANSAKQSLQDLHGIATGVDEHVEDRGLQLNQQQGDARFLKIVPDENTNRLGTGQETYICRVQIVSLVRIAAPARGSGICNLLNAHSVAERFCQMLLYLTGSLLDDFISLSDRFDRMLVTPGRRRRVLSTNEL